MIATQGFHLLGEDFRGSSPLSALAWINDNIALQPADCPEGQLDQR